MTASIYIVFAVFKEKNRTVPVVLVRGCGKVFQIRIYQVLVLVEY
jgi:hypothetical protein